VSEANQNVDPNKVNPVVPRPDAEGHPDASRPVPRPVIFREDQNESLARHYWNLPAIRFKTCDQQNGSLPRR
jgi:hypothetical protein